MIDFRWSFFVVSAGWTFVVPFRTFGRCLGSGGFYSSRINRSNGIRRFGFGFRLGCGFVRCFLGVLLGLILGAQTFCAFLFGPFFFFFITAALVPLTMIRLRSRRTSARGQVQGSMPSRSPVRPALRNKGSGDRWASFPRGF